MTRADVSSDRDRRARTHEGRVVSLDAVRGFAIGVMLVVANAGIVRAMPAQLKHARPEGFTFADSIFPLFLFAIGTSMLYSSRAARAPDVLRRTAILFAIGVALASLRDGRLVVSWGVLQRIAVAYLIAWAVLRASTRWRVGIAAAIVVVTTVAYLIAPPDDFRRLWTAGGGLVSLADGRMRLGFSVVATVGTVLAAVHVIGGAFAGRIIKDHGGGPRAFVLLVGAAAGFITLGLGMGAFVPISQGHWSPSFTILALGVAFAYFAAMHALCQASWSKPLWFPLVVLGTNAIAVYVASFGMRDLVLSDHVRPRLVEPLVAFGGEPFAALAYTFVVSLVWFAFCAELYRRRIFLRV